MGKSAPEPPPVPDPVAMAAAQTQSNLATARTNATLNRVDQYTPNGSSTWTPLANTYVANELANRRAAYDADARPLYTGPLTTTVTTPGTGSRWVDTAGENSGGGYYTDTPATTTTQPVSISGNFKAPWNEAAARAELEANNPLADRWRQDVTLSPEQQGLMNLQNQAKSLYGTTALSQLQGLQGALSSPFNPTTLPNAPTGVTSQGGALMTAGPGLPTLNTNLPSAAGQLQYNAPTLGPMGTVRSREGELFGGTLTAPVLQSNAPSNFAATLPEQLALELAYASHANELARTFGANVPGIQYGVGAAGEIQRNVDADASSRNRVEEALFGRMNPQIEQTRLALETRLRNQGLAPGGEAWMNSLNDIQRQENDARLAVIAQAGQEQSRQLGMDLSRGQFTNAAQQQAFAQEVGRQQALNAAQQQGFGQSRDVAAFGNQAVVAAQGLDSQAIDSRNTAQNQMFAQSVQAAQIANDAAARNAALGQQAEQMRLNAQLAQFNAQMQAAGFQNAQAGQAQQMDLAGGSFNNQAALARFGAGIQGMGANNQAVQTGFGMNSAAAGFNNAALQQAFGNQLQAATFGNQALGQRQALDAQAQQTQGALRQAALQEQLTLRSVPLNETAALFGQAGVQYPQFGQVPTANVATTDMLGAYGMAQNAAQAAYNTQAQQAAANTSGLFGGLSSLGGAGIMAYALSDERAKENVREVGELDNGLPVYLFTYKGSPTPQIGLMAQDVEKKKPSAVTEGADGYKRVNYAMATR